MMMKRIHVQSPLNKFRRHIISCLLSLPDGRLTVCQYYCMRRRQSGDSSGFVKTENIFGMLENRGCLCYS